MYFFAHVFYNIFHKRDSRLEYMLMLSAKSEFLMADLFAGLE